MAPFKALCAAAPIHKLQKSPKRRFTNVSFGLFSQFRPITRKQVTNDPIYLDIWRYNYLVLKNILSKSLYQQQ